MRLGLPLLLTTVALVGCADAENSDSYVRRPDALGESPVPDSSAVDTGAKPSDSTVKDTGSTDSGSSDTGDPDTGDPDTGSFDVGFPDIGGGKCMYCSSGVCPTLLIDYSCLLNCLVDGFADCTYTYGAPKPCVCIP